MFALPLMCSAQTYQEMWKRVEKAQGEDKPKTVLSLLGTLEKKAEKEGRYGHLIAAWMSEMSAWEQVSADSVLTNMKRLQDRELAMRQKNSVAALMMRAAMWPVTGRMQGNSGRIKGNSNHSDSSESIKAALLDVDSLIYSADSTALLEPDGADEYLPLLKKEADSRYYSHDLLSVVGRLTEQYASLYRLYSSVGYRQAAAITAANMLTHDLQHYREVEYYDSLIAEADKLIEKYYAIPECAAIAMAKYSLLQARHEVKSGVQEMIAWIDEALQRWPSWKEMNTLRNARMELTNPQFSATLSSNYAYSAQELKVSFSEIRNLSGANVKVTRLAYNGGVLPYDLNNAKVLARLRKMMQPQTERTFVKRFAERKEYEYDTDTLSLGTLPIGLYLVEVMAANDSKKVSRSLLHVSDLRVIVQELPNRMIRRVVVDAISGKPVAGAKLHFPKRADNPDEQFCAGKQYNENVVTTDANGESVMTIGRDDRDVYATTPDDCYSMPSYIWTNFYSHDSNDLTERVKIFTDRSIYRPGQTVKAVLSAYVQRGTKDINVSAGKEMKMTMRDAKYKVVAEKTVTTDEFGTASVEFELPAEGNNGVYSIRTDRGYVSFSVEEYVRPTFDVSMTRPQEAFQNGDTVMVKGIAKTYSGMPVAGAKVRYSVNRNHVWWLRMEPGSEELADGAGETAADGSFTIPMPMIVPKGLNPKRTFCYSVVAEVTVTDLAGESHEARLSLPLSNRKSFLSVSLDEATLSDSVMSVMVERRNAIGENIDGKVTLTTDFCKNIEIEANKQVNLTEYIDTLLSGRHTITAVCEGDTAKYTYAYQRLTDLHPAADTHFWWKQTARMFPETDGKVSVQYGSSKSDVHAFYTLVSGNRLIESGVTRLDSALVRRDFEYQEEYGNGITYTVAWMKDGQLYSGSASISKFMPDQQLNIQWETFRDRLTPGQNEEWTLRITDAKGKPAKARVIATMYDKSLDAIKPHYWNLGVYKGYQLPSMSWNMAMAEVSGFYYSRDCKYLDTKQLMFTHFDERYTFLNAVDEVMYMSMPMRSMSARKELRFATQSEGIVVGMAAPMADAAVNTSAMLKSVPVTMKTETAEAEEMPAPDTDNSSIPVRENLEETAFFQPSLTTDDKGGVAIRFTLPESVTTWHFMGMAFDKTMRNGRIDADAVAQKELMIQPRVPRFLREGDECRLTASVANMTDKDAETTVILTIIDAETERTIHSEKKTVRVDANGTAAVSFDCSADKLGDKTLICRMTAESGNYKDGEQHLLPVLPASETLVNTMAVILEEKGNARIDVSDMLPKDVSDGTMTVGYTDNPEWLVVEALFREEATTDGRQKTGFVIDDNAISLASACYTKLLSLHLLKDSELLRDRYDEQKVKAAADKLIGRLANLQNADGSWSWWKGMSGSRYITVTVAEMLYRISRMGDSNAAVSELLNRTYRYLDTEMAKDVSEMKKREKKGENPVLNNNHLDYLYCSLGRQHNDTQKYLFSLLAKSMNFADMRTKAMAAIVLNAWGEKATAETYVESILEHTVMREDMGRYFDSPRAAYSWCDYRIPTQVSVIEALQAVAPESKAIREMQRWLLQSKRTQEWDTPINAVNAVYAFFNGSTARLQKGTPATIRLDGKKLKDENVSENMGSIRAVTGVTHKSKTVSVDKKSEGESWATVAVEFRQQMDSIQARSNGLTVTRQMESGKQLRVGDKVKVVITVTADRDYDFVSITDNRPACLEPVRQLSGYRNGCYEVIHDKNTSYNYNMLAKGTHRIETEYYVTRAGKYQAGTVSAVCTYAPEFCGRTAATTISTHDDYEQ